MKKIFFIFAGLISFGYVHASSHRLDQRPTTLGYLELKSNYAKAAWEEGKLAAIKKVLEHKHRRTGRPYPCWNALKPFADKNLPVSISLPVNEQDGINKILTLASWPADQFDSSGKDGRLSSKEPQKKEGYTRWRIDETFQRIPQIVSQESVIGLVDISGSMHAKKKWNTLRGLKAANIQFKHLYIFSGKGSLKETSLDSLSQVRPEGKTALYDNLLELLEKYPQEIIFVVTDGRDNASQTKLKELLNRVSEKNNKIDVALTGRNADDRFAEIAQKTNGQIFHDRYESGAIKQPVLEVTILQ